MIIEAKVLLPFVVNGGLTALTVSLFKVLAEFNLFNPTASQSLALASFGAAVLLVLQVLIGYRAPHTDRPDLYGNGAGYPADPVYNTTIVQPSAETVQDR